VSGAGGVVVAALQAVQAWLIEPPDSRPRDTLPATGAPPRRTVAVFGLSRGCGASVVARALAVELAARDPAGAAAVGGEAATGSVRLGAPAAARLAGSLADVPGAATRATGRICLVAGAGEPALVDCARHFAPVVLDAGSDALGGLPAAVADRNVLVAAPDAEPALATVAAACLGRAGPEPIVVVNGGEHERWQGRAALSLPRSRVGAQFALGGREPRGELGRAVARLADLVEAPP
jgi:hypothetical protein